MSATLDPEQVLAGLDPEQRAVALAPRGPVCVLAGAGTGKTRAITHRIAHGVVSGQTQATHVLAVTFTARAAGEMRVRLRGLGVGGVQARTFHAAALRQLSYFHARAFGSAMPELVASKARLVAEAAGRLRLPTKGTALRDLTAEVEWAKSCLLTPDGYAERAASLGRGSVAGQTPEVVGRLYEEYERVRRRHDLVDFEEVLLLMAGVLTEHADIADEVHAQYRHLVVDEYQDVTPLQQALLDAWLGGRDDLTVVGDAAQTIYSFTGASPQWLLGFGRRYPTAPVVRLVRDYRSTPQVVALANQVLAGSGEALTLVAQRPDGPAPTFVEAQDEPAEAAAVAARVAALLRAGTPAREVAVLFRVNAQSEAYEAALAGVGVPYLLRGGERFFDRGEVREAVVLLRGAARALDEGAPPSLGLHVREVLAERWAEAAPPPVTARAERERWDNLAALVRLADDLAVSEPRAALPRLVTELEERARSQHVPDVEGVTLASLHAAKGLEWDAVFLVGLVDGTLPLVHADTPEAMAEERRLLYVGVTRAREMLCLSWALSRAAGGRASRRPSRFLDGIRPGLVAAPRPVAGAKVRKPPSCRRCGGALSSPEDKRSGRCSGCAPSVDDALFEALRTWRSERARELKQPAYCVFTDATLEAIAEVRPGTRGELAGVRGVGGAKLTAYADEVLALVGASGSD